MGRSIRRRRRPGRRRLARSWRRSGGLWGGDWSLCCRGRGWCRRLPPFRKVRGRMGHPLRLRFLLLLLLLLAFLPGLRVGGGGGGGGGGAPVAPGYLEGAAGETLDELQAVVSGRTADGETIFLLALDQIDPNPYQTRREFDVAIK